MRENTSRPYWSVPNQCSAPGVDSMAAKSMASGSKGEIHAAPKAHTT